MLQLRFGQRVASAFFVLLLCAVTLGAQPRLVADLVRTGVNEGSIEAHAFQRVEFQGRLYFAADHPRYGVELWSTDGTADGLRLVGDLCPGRCASQPEALTVWKDRLYFFADDGAFGRELWSLDAQGELQLLRDICPGSCDAFRKGAAPPTALGEELYLVTWQGSFERRLWRTDGSHAGTIEVRALPAGVNLPPGPDRLLVTRDLLFLLLYEPGSTFPLARLGLWSFDGEVLQELSDPLTFEVALPGLARTVAGELWFAGSTARVADGLELWRTDGSPEGTRRLEEICFGSCSALDSEAFVLDLAGHVYVGARSPNELSPMRLHEVVGGDLRRVTGAPTGPFKSAAVLGDSLLLFVQRAHTLELWLQSVGEPTQHFHTLETQSPESTVSQVTIDDRAYFLVDGLDLWTTDGTAAGTRLLGRPPSPSDLTPLSGLSGSATSGSGLVFTADDLVRGREPWIADLEGVRMLHDVRPEDTSSGPRRLGALDGLLLFDVEQPDGIWTSDGVTASLLSATPASVESFYFYNDLLFFTSAGPIDAGLWCSDGDGVEKIFDHLYEGQAFFAYDRISSHQLLFAARHHDQELWSTDGTPEGTRQVADLAESHFPGLPTPISSQPRELTRLGDQVLFSGYADESAAYGRHLFRTDGTTAGSGLVQDLQMPGFLGRVSNLTLLADTGFGDIVLMAAEEEQAGLELAVTDGTPEGTRIHSDIVPGPESSHPSFLRSLGNRVLFFTSIAQGQRVVDSLWSTDGQTPVDPQHDVLSVLEIQGQPAYVLDAEVAGRYLFFVVASEATGAELWVSDGTPAGTHLLQDIRPGRRGSHPQHLTVIGDLLVFSADDGRHGRELWVSDGRRVRQVSDLVAGPGSSTPELMTAAGDDLFFSADDGVAGRELWVLPLSTLRLAPERQQRLP